MGSSDRHLRGHVFGRSCFTVPAFPYLDEHAFLSFEKGSKRISTLAVTRGFTCKLGKSARNLVWFRRVIHRKLWGIHTVSDRFGLYTPRDDGGTAKKERRSKNNWLFCNCRRVILSDLHDVVQRVEGLEVDLRPQIPQWMHQRLEQGEPNLSSLQGRHLSLRVSILNVMISLVYRYSYKWIYDVYQEMEIIFRLLI